MRHHRTIAKTGNSRTGFTADIDRLAPPDVNQIVRIYRQIARQSDCMIIEGAGGLAVPVTWGMDYAEFARILSLELVVVIGNRLGCLNAAMLTFRYAKCKGAKLAGYVLNDFEAEPIPEAVSNESSLRRLADVRFLGRVRLKEPVSRELIDAVLT